MTNNEAVSKIKFLLDAGGSDGFTSSERDALNAAINALSECKKPKTNGDRIRQMTDEELAEWFAPYMMCSICDKNDNPYGCDLNECKKYALVYMKKEVSGYAID